MKSSISILIIILLFLVGLEFYISTIYDNSEWFVPDKFIGWKHQSNLTSLYSGHDFKAKIHTNSEGFVDVDHSIKKKQNITRIAILGDSFTEALQVDFNKSFSRLLEQKLTNVEVLNFGVSSFGTDNQLLISKPEISAL